MEVKVKKLDPNAVIPTKANISDAGLDLTATSVKSKWEGDELLYDEYGTGLAFEIPEGHVGYIFPRSSISKTDLSLANAVGVIDAGYRGEVKFRFRRNIILTTNGGITANTGRAYQEGDRIGQLIIMPIPTVTLKEVDELDTSERGDGGFGSSGS